MDVSLEKFNEPKWKRSNALARLFFESGSLKLLCGRVRTFLQEGSIEAAGATPGGMPTAWRSLKLDREKFPGMIKPCEQSPVIWLRLGFVLQSEGVVLSDSFIASYAEWRQACSEEFGGAIGVRYRRGSRPPETWPLDYFLLGRNLDFEIPSKSEVSLLPSHEGNSITSKRICADVVGRHVLALIRECVTDAVVLQKIKGLTKEMDRERYICYLTREALANALRSKYPHMREIGLPTIIRSVGTFVACSRPRRR